MAVIANELTVRLRCDVGRHKGYHCGLNAAQDYDAFFLAACKGNASLFLLWKRNASPFCVLWKRCDLAFGTCVTSCVIGSIEVTHAADARRKLFLALPAAAAAARLFACCVCAVL